VCVLAIKIEAIDVVVKGFLIVLYVRHIYFYPIDPDLPVLSPENLMMDKLKVFPAKKAILAKADAQV
jgi:hypothetical protein